MILVISYPDEDHTVEVIKRLEGAGRDVTLLDLADFPARSPVVLSWLAADRPSYVVHGPTGPIELRDTRVCWWRRVRPFTIDDALAVPSLRAFAESETSQAVGGMLDALHCAWVNPRRADEAAHQKPYQWQVARDVGLSVPRTLVTSEPEAARRFISEVGLGRTVFKAFLASLEAWRETRLIEQADLDRLDLVRYAPVIFQEYVEGVDLRVTIVGDRMFAAEIDARATSYPVDMRMVISEAEVKPTTLPDHVQGALLALQSRLGLKYGAIDMRRTAEGDCVFLEVNPAGQWLFVERLTGLPISQAVADYLATLDDYSGVGRDEEHNW